jgi:hypothetical protein
MGLVVWGEQLELAANGAAIAPPIRKKKAVEMMGDILTAVVKMFGKRMEVVI